MPFSEESILHNLPPMEQEKENSAFVKELHPLLSGIKQFQGLDY